MSTFDFLKKSYRYHGPVSTNRLDPRCLQTVPQQTLGFLRAGLSLHQLCAATYSRKAEVIRKLREAEVVPCYCGQHGGHNVAPLSFHPRESSHCATGGITSDPLLLTGPEVSSCHKGNTSYSELRL